MKKNRMASFSARYFAFTHNFAALPTGDFTKNALQESFLARQICRNVMESCAPFAH